MHVFVLVQASYVRITDKKKGGTLRFIISGHTDVQYLGQLIADGDGEMRKLCVEDGDGRQTTLTVNPAAQRVRINPPARPGVILLDHFGGRARIVSCREPDDGFELEFVGGDPPKRFLKALAQPERVLQSA